MLARFLCSKELFPVLIDHKLYNSFPLQEKRLDFTNILRADFTRPGPKSVKIQSSHHYLFAHLGSAHVKAAHKMLVKWAERRQRRRRCFTFNTSLRR